MVAAQSKLLELKVQLKNMAKKTEQSKKVETTALEISREIFKTDLEQIISNGTDLYNSTRNITNHIEFEAAQRAYNSWDDYNREFLKVSFNNPHNEYKVDYEDAGVWTSPIYLGNAKPLTTQEQYSKLLRKIQFKLDNLNQLLNKTNLLKCLVQPTEVSSPASIPSIVPTLEIFIVHGHDDAARLEVSRFLENLGFKPIVLNEQASSSRTIIEKIEEYSNVGFAIVLYTPCDIGYKNGKENEQRNRARQNVVFEHGYLMGKIGRKNVCALVKDDVETPNDISGIVYVTMDTHHGWKLKLGREMKNSGYEVDLNKI